MTEPDLPTDLGYGTGSDRSSSGASGDAKRPAGDDIQTDWLRDEA